MNIKKGDSLIGLIEGACHKQTLQCGHAHKQALPRGMPNPTKAVVLNKLLDGDENNSRKEDVLNILKE